MTSQCGLRNCVAQCVSEHWRPVCSKVINSHLLQWTLATRQFERAWTHFVLTLTVRDNLSVVIDCHALSTTVVATAIFEHHVSCSVIV